MKFVIYQSKTPQNAQTVNQLENQIHDARRHNAQIEDVPTALKEFFRQRHELENALESKHQSEDL